MPIEVQTALISAVVALITAIVGGLLSWSQLRRERDKWLIDFKSTYSIELYKTRLNSYGQAFEIIGKLSHRGKAVTEETAELVAGDLNTWLYSVGGLCAGTRARGAILGLRECCHRWASQGGKRPGDLYAWRNAALALLRLDLDLQGLESYDFDNPQSLLSQLQAEIRSLQQRSEDAPSTNVVRARLESPIRIGRDQPGYDDQR